MGIHHRLALIVLLILLLMPVTLQWDYTADQEAKITGYWLIQWRGTAIDKKMSISKTSRGVTLHIDEADKYRLHWTIRAFNATDESKDSNAVGFKPDKPEVGLEY